MAICRIKTGTPWAGHIRDDEHACNNDNRGYNRTGFMTAGTMNVIWIFYLFF